MSAVVARRTPARRHGLPLTPEQIAWIVLIPCAMLMLAVIVVLGPPLGRALFDPGSNALWPVNWWEARGHAEPAKHGRYMLAELAPLMLAGTILVVVRRPPRLRLRTSQALVLFSQACVVAIVAVAVLGQRHLILYKPLPAIELRFMPAIFSIRDLVVAATLVVGAAILLRRRRVGASIVAFARERPLTRVAGLAIATAFAATWLIEAVLSDGTIEDSGMINWVPDGVFAVLDGRTPLVNVHLIYTKLLPYPAALVLAAFGANLFVFTVFLALLDLAAMLAVYTVFRRLVGSAFAVALFLPFVAMSDAGHFIWAGGVWPMRYVGAYLVGWLTARHVDGDTPRRRWVIFFVAGLVLLDTLDFGLAALLASTIALICAQPPRSLRDATRLAGAITGGVLGALAVVTALTLARTGELPRLALLFEWPRIFTNLGWFSLPLPQASLHLAIYVTFAATIAVAAVRLARRAEDVLLTVMLAWSGVFGLIAGNYYVARPDDFKLYAMCSAWRSRSRC